MFKKYNQFGRMNIIVHESYTFHPFTWLCEATIQLFYIAIKIGTQIIYNFHFMHITNIRH